MTRTAAPLVLDPGQRELLESLAKSRDIDSGLKLMGGVLDRFAAAGLAQADALTAVQSSTTTAGSRWD